ncbi:MAG: hypothetical protein LBQ93_07705 [Treponema sp.]|jgi:hypothetical protein|nr:hypothetical protein [Treponema sp.]
MNVVYIVLIVCLAVNFFMFFYFKWYVKRRTSASGFLPEYRAEVNRLIADIDAATDRDSQLVEERIKKLKEILDDTDKRISVYVKELEKSRTGEALYTSLGRGIRAALKTEAGSAPVQNAPVPQLSIVKPNIEVQPQPASVSRQTLPYESASAEKQPEYSTRKNTAAEQQTQKPPSKRQIRAHIDLLANEGLPVEAIASQLGISIAEVDLAMNLRKR